MTAHAQEGPSPGSLRSARPSGRLGLQVVALVVATMLTLAGLAGITALVARPGAGPVPSPTAPSYLVDEVRPAPALGLTGTDARPFSLESMRGRGALVFFGYTHCPDVCPATIGIVGQVIERIGPTVGAVFVSIDPERDTVPWLADYVRYLPQGFVALTGATADVRAAADAWGVRYAKVEGEDPERYSMTHTANVYLVDQEGLLRAVFPFGVQPDGMVETVREVLAAPAATVYPETALPAITPTPPPTLAPATAAPTIAPTATAPTAALRAEIVSSSVWAGGSSPVILALYDADGRRLDVLDARVRVQLARLDGTAVGPLVDAVTVQPRGVADVSYVATMDIPGSGWWRLEISVQAGVTTSSGAVNVVALDPGGTAPLGRPAPATRTPILDDVDGRVLELTTDPIPDLRLYRTSTADALAAGKPFVLVVDSTKFQTTTACGKALIMARYLLDRWAAIPFIHVEPFEYEVITSTAMLVGTLSNPTLVPAVQAWGIGPQPWGATSMPWIFIVDGSGIVRAKYQGIIGTADVDVVLSLIAAGG